MHENNSSLQVKRKEWQQNLEIRECCQSKNMSIKILKVEPYRAPEVVELDSLELEYMQQQVATYSQNGEALSEAIYCREDKVAIIINEEGLCIKGCVKNRWLKNTPLKFDYVVRGTFLIVGMGKEYFCGLSDWQLLKYKEVFKLPQIFTFDNESHVYYCHTCTPDFITICSIYQFPAETQVPLGTTIDLSGYKLCSDNQFMLPGESEVRFMQDRVFMYSDDNDFNGRPSLNNVIIKEVTPSHEEGGKDKVVYMAYNGVKFVNVTDKIVVKSESL